MRAARILGSAIGFAASLPLLSSLQAQTISVGANYLSGVVSGPNGPEAGVWVIAETGDLPTRFAKIVATDDQGRFVVPDLPQANYSVWVRGYGLVDSQKQRAVPGATVNLTAVPAPSPAAAADYYPAIYWYSMLKIPDKSQFGGASDIPARVTQTQYLTWIKNTGCIGCHQLGNLATRTIPPSLGKFESSEEAWMRRVQSGQAGESMLGTAANMLGGAPFRYFADWTDRIAKGELPQAAPPRPQGIERNIVVTVRDWLNEKHYLHDLAGTDRRRPTVNGYGLLYGATEYSVDEVPTLDPVKNVAGGFKPPVRDAGTPVGATVAGPAASADLLAPSPYWGDEVLWTSKSNIHNPMIDGEGRVWFTATVRGPDNPAGLTRGSTFLDGPGQARP